MAQQKKYNKSGNRPYNQHKNRNYDNRNRKDDRNNKNRRQDNRNDNRKSEEQQTTKEKPRSSTQSKAESSNDLIIFIVFLIALPLFFLARKFYFPPEKNQLLSFTSNLKFMKEGKLTFFDAQTEKAIIGIDIEVAKSTYEIEKGLMHRRSLPANGGMLFIFDEEHYRTFWMKDTYIGLDILFLNSEKEIIRICKNAAPLSLSSIPSGGKAMFVVEVLAGFTKAYNIHIGDHIEFTY